MSMFRSYPRLWTAAAVLLLLSACESVSVTVVEVASIAVTPSQGILLPGDTLRLTNTAYSGSGSLLEGRAVSWTSENESVATVSSSGLVESHSVGQTTIRASSGGASGTATVLVRPPPEIVLSASELSFGGTSGGDPTDPVQLLVTSSEGGPLFAPSVEVVYTPGQATGWLEANLLQGSQAPATLSVRARPATLPSGLYEAEIRVHSAQATNSPQSISVNFEVAAPLPSIQLSTSAFGILWEEGQPAPTPQVVRIANSGGGELDGLATSVRHGTGQPTGWLTAELNRTIAPAELTLRTTPGALPRGTFDALVDISSHRATNSPQVLRFRLTVGAPPPELGLDPETLQWSILEGSEGDPPTRTVTLANRGSGTLGGLSASVSHPQSQPTGWLNVSLGSETAPTDLTVGLAAQGLLPGTYRGTVAVASADAVNSPQLLTVELQVMMGLAPELSAILAAPDRIVADGVSTSTITVLLRDAQGAPLSSGGHQVALNTTRGTLGSVTDEGDGTYTATLTAPTRVGTASITGTVDGAPIGGSATVVLTPGSISPEESEVDASPTSGIAADGQAASTVTVRLRDAHGNPVEGVASGDFVVEVSGSGSAGTVTETSTTGTYRFSVTNTVAETVTVTVSAVEVTLADQPSITFVSESGNRIVFGVQPPDAEAGAAMSPAVTLRLEDEFGNLVGSSRPLTVSIATNPSGGTLSGTTTRNAVNGVATFDDLSIDNAGDGYTLRASGPGASSTTSRAFDITASGITVRSSMPSRSLGHDALWRTGRSRVDHGTTLEVVDHSRGEDGVDHVGKGEWLTVLGVADVVDLDRSPVDHDHGSRAEDRGGSFVLDQEPRVFLEPEPQQGWVRGDRVYQSGDP
jgi:hypothetical protein